MRVMLVILFWLFSVTAYATSKCPAGYKETISKSGYPSGQCYQDTDTDTDTDTLGQPQDQAGIGADVVLWENKKGSLVEEVTAEYRRDLDNNTNAIYGVVRINLWSKLKRHMAIKKALDKGEKDGATH